MKQPKLRCICGKFGTIYGDFTTNWGVLCEGCGRTGPHAATPEEAMNLWAKDRIALSAHEMLLSALRTLIEVTEGIEDEVISDGCGHFDTFQSSALEEAISNAQHTINRVTRGGV